MMLFDDDDVRVDCRPQDVGGVKMSKVTCNHTNTQRHEQRDGFLSVVVGGCTLSLVIASRRLRGKKRKQVLAPF
eukprot:scaffold1600_cov179-Amphora_coffeaeformis.AAC.3